MFNRILIVCVGNICRSPMAEGMLKNWLASKNSTIEVTSAGVAAVVDKPPTRIAQALMQSRNIDISSHVARQITEEMVREADLILVMENSQKKRIENVYPFSLGKVFLLGKWEEEFEIPDPYGGIEPDYEDAYVLINKGLISWQKKICPQ
jgi:protein-tyrosine phosphatase